SRRSGVSVSAPSSNTCRLLARDHRAPEPTLALGKAVQPCCGHVRTLAWRSRPRSSAALPDGALMRIAALYDIHGNLPALEAVLADVDREGVDEVVFGGDLTWGPLPRETLELVRSVDNAAFVRGNA